MVVTIGNFILEELNLLKAFINILIFISFINYFKILKN